MRLRTRFVLLILVVVFGGGSVSTYLVGRLIHQNLHAAESRWVTGLVKSIAEGITRDTIDGNAIHAEETLRTLVADLENLEYAFIIDFDQRLFAHSFEDGLPQALADRDFSSVPEDVAYRPLSGDMLEASRPLIDGLGAHLHLGLNSDSTHRLIRDTQQQILLITGIVALLGSVLALIIAHRISVPLQRFSALVRAYGHGTVEEPLRISGADRDVAPLIGSFNQMLADRTEFEAALRESETRFRALVESTTDWIWEID